MLTAKSTHESLMSHSYEKQWIVTKETGTDVIMGRRAKTAGAVIKEIWCIFAGEMKQVNFGIVSHPPTCPLIPRSAVAHSLCGFSRC